MIICYQYKIFNGRTDEVLCYDFALNMEAMMKKYVIGLDGIIEAVCAWKIKHKNV